jgi:uncharacterized repeat protein (TIGR02543 family)
MPRLGRTRAHGVLGGLLAPGALVFLITALASCALTIGPAAKPGLDLGISFKIHGLPLASQPAAKGARLLLPTATSLRVSLKPVSAAVEGPPDQTADISGKSEVTVKFQNVIRAVYKLRAEASDATGVLFLREIDLNLLSSSELSAPIYLIPNGGDDLGLLPQFVNATAASPVAVAAGSSHTWLCPPMTNFFSLYAAKNASLQFYLQDLDGGGALLPIDDNGTELDFGVAAPDTNQFLLTVYNPSAAPITPDFGINKDLTLSYLANDTGLGTAAGTPPDAIATARYKMPIPVPNYPGAAPAGYSFGNWNTVADGSGTTCNPGTTYTMGATNAALYAQWVLGQAVLFNANGGTGTMSTQIIVSGSSANLTTNGFSRPGYAFAGWNTAANGSGTSYADGASYTMGTNGATLYAQWTPISYGLVFDANGGTGSMGTQNIPFETSATLNANTYARTGYSFTGWGTNAAGPVAYADGAAYTMGTQGSTLYAQWSLNTYTITFSENYGTTPATTTQNLVYNAVANLSPNAFTRSGYAFAGWATSSAGPVAYADGASYTMGAGNATLYAIWAANAHIVIFDANLGSGTMAPQSIGDGLSASLTANVFTRSGYAFTGWGTAQAGPVVYPDGASYTMGSADQTLYAQWVQLYTISFDANGGTGTMTSQGIATGSSAALRANVFTLSGCSFAGWATTPTGPVAYADGAVYAMGAADATLYAVWLSALNGFVLSLNNPSDASANLSIGGIPISAQPVLARSLSAFISVDADPGYANYLWTMTGVGTAPGIAGGSTSSATISTSSGTTGFGVWTVTLFFGNGAAGNYDYSKSFTIMVTE